MSCWILDWISHNSNYNKLSHRQFRIRAPRIVLIKNWIQSIRAQCLIWVHLEESIAKFLLMKRPKKSMVILHSNRTLNSINNLIISILLPSKRLMKIILGKRTQPVAGGHLQAPIITKFLNLICLFFLEEAATWKNRVF